MNQRVHTTWKILVVAAAYFCGGYLGLKLARINPSVTAVWPPSGIAIAVLLLSGIRVWPGIFIGALLVNLVTQGPWGSSVCIAVGNTLEGVTAAWLVRRHCGGLATFERATDILKFVAFAGVFSTAISATIGVTSLCLFKLADWHNFRWLWLTWWTGDAVGSLELTPLIVLWSRPLTMLPWKKIVEGVFALISVALVALAVFDLGNYPFGFMMVPPLMWATLRFGRHGAILSCVLMAFIAMWGTMQGYGPYATGDLNESMLFVQAYVGIVTMSALVLAAVVSENRRTLYELRVQEQEAQERLGELETLMETAPAVIWMAHDAECRVITGNQLGEEILRMPWGKNLSKTSHGMAHYEVYKDGRRLSDAELPMQVVGRERKPLWKYEMEIRFPDGPSQWLYGNVVPLLKPDGSVRGVLAVFVDITERKGAEEALAKSQAELARLNQELDERVRNRTVQLQSMIEELEGFSYSVSHDLRGPLRSIQSFSQIVLADYADKLDVTGVELLRKVARGAERLDRLIQDVLAFSRVSRQEIKIADVDVDRLVRQIVQERPEWQPPKAEIEIHGTLPRVRGHEPSLTQCITNFLDNAVKFVAPGTKPKVVISADVVDNKIRLWFQDNGIGIEPGMEQRMFGMFQRFHRDSAYPGTGIGLAIVRKAVERMNGTVGVESEPGTGSRFWLELERAN